MKKILSFLLPLVLCLSGCLSNAKEPAQKYFIFATPLKNHEIWLQAKEGFEDACQELGVHGDWIGPAVIDLEEMEQVIETGILQKADGIITQGVISQSLVDMAAQKGIPMILVDSDVPDSRRIAFMGKDFHEQALLFLEQTEAVLGKEEPLKIAIQAANLEFDIGKEQVQEIETVFSTHPGGYEIVSTSQSLSEDLRAKKEWEQVLNDHPEINVAINFAAESARFCYEAAKMENRQDDILIFAVDDMPSTLQMIKDGEVEGSVVTSFYQYGYKGVYLLMDYLEDGTLNREASVSLSMVTKNNVNTYRDREGEGNED